MSPMKEFIGFKEALELTLSHVVPGETEILPLERLVGSVLAEDVAARVDCPSVSASRKDGYAVVSTDLAAASEQNLVSLEIKGNLSAGDRRELKIKSGQAVRVTTGAPLPEGADAVLSEEFCRLEGNTIAAFNSAEAGRNIHQRARDIRIGETVAGKNTRLHPALIGLLAAAGLDAAAVYRPPRVAVIASGDEVVTPGSPLQRGQLYASNMVESCAWLSQFGLPYKMELVPDCSQTIENTITKHLPDVDAFLTSGGAWGSERDLILAVVEGLKWQARLSPRSHGSRQTGGIRPVGGQTFFLPAGRPPFQ